MSTAKSSLYLSFATVIYMIASYLSTVWLGRTLGPVSYGQYGVLMGIITLVGLIQNNGVCLSAAKFIAEGKYAPDDVMRTAIKLQLATALVLSGGLALLAIPLSIALGDEGLRGYILLAALVFPIYGLYALYYAYYNGRQDFWKQARINILYSLGKAGFVILLAMWFGLAGALLGFIAAPLFALLTGAQLKLERPKKAFPWKDLLRYSLPLIAYAIITTLMLSVDLFFVKRNLPDETTGYYTSAQNIALTGLLAVGALGQVMFPHISQLKAAGKQQQASNAISTALRYILLMLLPLTALVAGAAPHMAALFFGEQYLPASIFISILACSYVGITLFGLLGNVLNGSGHASTATWIAGASLVISVVLCVLLVGPLGAEGAAIAIGVGGAVATLAGLIAVRKIFDYRVRLLSVARIVIGSCGVWYIAGFTPNGPLFSLGWWALLGACYMSWLLVSREITAEDRRYAMALLSRRPK